MIDRAVFVGGYRMGHAVMAFHFDQFLTDLGTTYFVTNIDEKHYKETLIRYGIDTNRFIYVNDQDIISKYPEILNWDRPGDYRGTWLRQQALKIASLDYFDFDQLLIQDPDTFAIKPYSCFKDRVPNLFVLPNESHSIGYYVAIENSLGISRQTTDCFVTEFMPFLKEDWISLKTTLETRHQTSSLDAIINNCRVEQETNLIWFSEYEFLGNYILTQRSIETTVQQRFEIECLDDIKNLNSTDYNCYADACTDHSKSILFDFETNTIPNFNTIYQNIASRI